MQPYTVAQTALQGLRVLELQELKVDIRADDVYISAEQQMIDEEEPPNLGSDSL